MIQSAVQAALTMTQPMLLQLQQGAAPVIPIPRLTAAPRLAPMVLGSGRRQRTNNVNKMN